MLVIPACSRIGVFVIMSFQEIPGVRLRQRMRYEFSRFLLGVQCTRFTAVKERADNTGFVDLHFRTHG